MFSFWPAPRSILLQATSEYQDTLFACASVIIYEEQGIYM